MMPNPPRPTDDDPTRDARGQEIVDLPSRRMAAPPPRDAGGRLDAHGAPAGPRPRYGDGAVIACDGLVRIYKLADLEVVALQGLDLLVESGRDDRDRRGVGERQVHAAGHPRRDGRAVGRPGGRRRLRPGPHRRRGANALPPAGRRLRLAADGAQPAAVPDRGCRTWSCRWSSTAGSGGVDAGARAAGPRRARRPRDAPARSPVRRRAAAGGDRGRARERPERRPRRRADRRAGQRRPRRRCSGSSGA